MKPEMALQVLYEAGRLAPLSAEAHQNVWQAYKILQEKYFPKEEEEKPEKKGAPKKAR